ncbi:MAG TPA: hypothetical protein VK669_02215 [Candidatus Limnocylindrales bacterium]|nr:hypothetical protein [Candidatus Limnocylindrales bacterium]
MDVPSAVEKAFAYPAFTLREVAQALHPLVVISGGSSDGGTVPAPQGLLVVGAHRLSPLDMTPKRALGVVCAQRDGKVSIIPKTARTVSSCFGALQSGPMLIEPNHHFGMEHRDLPAYARAVLGLDTAGRYAYLIVSGEVDPYSLAAQLYRPVREGGLDLSAAIVLGSGAGHAGMIVMDRGTRRVFGNENATLPSAIATF